MSRRVACLLSVFFLPAMAWAADASRPSGHELLAVGLPRVSHQTLARMTSLLRKPAVREEITLGEAQWQEINKLWKRVRSKHKERAQAVRGLPAQQRAQKYREIQSEVNKIYGELATILQPDQLLRVMQIYVQQRGIHALNELSEELEITDQQRNRMNQIRSESAKKRSALYRSLQKDKNRREKLREQLQELQQEAEEEMYGVLTPQQRERLAKLKGREFDLKKLSLRR